MTRSSWSALLIGAILTLISVWRIQAAAEDLVVTPIPSSNPPTTVVAPADVAGVEPPVVLIAHGFAGSARLMRGFAFTLAHAGYTTVNWDFNGHAANSNPFQQDSARDRLQADAEAALRIAIEAGFTAGERVAILGHSMGSGAALSYGTVHPGTAATVAISPVSRTVTPELPRNLLLLAGSNEPRFVTSAEELLEDAGGQGGEHAAGSARELTVIPGVEHISILFSPTGHRAAQGWLDQTFGVQPGAQDYTDRRIAWYGVGLVGVILLTWGLMGSMPDQRGRVPVSRGWGLRFAPVVGALGAIVALWGLSGTGLELTGFLGLQVGGYLFLWFGLAGLIGLGWLRFRIYGPSSRELAAALVISLLLLFGTGLLAHSVWIHWLLIPGRLALWPLGAALSLPWFLAVGETLRGGSLLGRILGWLVHGLILTASFLVSQRLVSGLGVLILLVPMVPILVGLVELISARTRSPWPYAIGGALFVSWTLLAVFPMT